ncbi:hypothetical protein IEQ34_011049 [Dendrobium chrysotoxum]|uniref:Uncharacterized protein n=1 Tax=Dendrobium chrysotoxum TaxID=161865 RepID=A0AAV7GWH1_DENCH|nr:hypothetical protein IEQ34_011049 [Dendrobium chrysotoxum]
MLGSQGSKANFLQPREEGAIARIVHADSPAHSTSSASQSQSPSLATELESPNSTHLPEFENDSVYLKRNSMQQIFSNQVPDTTLSLRCSSMDLG